MVEDSIPTFETFCAHHDGASLVANQDYRKQYEDVVRTYASLASEAPVQGKGLQLTAPVLLRWRKAGLMAIKAIASSETLSSDAGRQLAIIVPVIMKNLYSGSDANFTTLQQRAHLRNQSEAREPPRRKMSVATARTSENSDTGALALVQTAADADKLAEEDIGLLALESLKKIFKSNVRSQIRSASAYVLDFIEKQPSARKANIINDARDSHIGSWATTLIEAIARWAQVQDRYIILIVTMDRLVRGPIDEENMENQLVLASLVSWLLSSNVNLIGLSVMDILLGLVNHILRLLRLGGLNLGPSLNSAPPTHNNSAVASLQPSRAASIDEESPGPRQRTPSHLRQEMLKKLQSCIGDLANHIYYSDQVSDMISAILLRLKPSPLSSIGTTASAIEDPEGAAQVIFDSAGLHDDSHTHDFFSFATARITALKAIKEILNTANSRSHGAGLNALGRNKVSVHVWEGTQWLLRDVDGRVRKAYVDALLTWLRREIGKGDLKALEEVPTSIKHKVRGRGEEHDLAKRAVSNASNREKSPRPHRSAFLQLLHLAIYENALQLSESEPDILILHALLTSLVEKLGVNSVKSSLPMIVRLQEDIQELESPIAKVHVGSLVHGYFWALSEKFDFTPSAVGREIQAEITRRRSKGLWVNKIQLPPIALDEISMDDASQVSQDLDWSIFETEALRPFDSRGPMVERISSAYTVALASPPSSPPTTPGRAFAMPLFGSPQTSNPANTSAFQLPTKVKDEMLSEWSRESLIAFLEKESSRSASLNGSRTGTNPSGTRTNFLAVNSMNGNAGSGTQTPQLHPYHHSRPVSAHYGLVGGSAPALNQQYRKVSMQDDSSAVVSSSSRNSTVRVKELKRILAGDVRPLTSTSRPKQDFATADASTDSMVSAGDISASDASYHDARVESQDFATEYDANSWQHSKATEFGRAARRGSVTPKASASTPHLQHAIEEDAESEGFVPPVPPIPSASALNLPGGFPASETALSRSMQGSLAGRSGKHKAGKQSVSSAWAQGREGVDIGSFLGTIEPGEGSTVNGKGVQPPPY